MLFHSVKNIKIVMYYLCKKCFGLYKYKYKAGFSILQIYIFAICTIFICKELCQLLQISICKTSFLKCKQTLM